MTDKSVGPMLEPLLQEKHMGETFENVLLETVEDASKHASKDVQYVTIAYAPV